MFGRWRVVVDQRPAEGLVGLAVPATGLELVRRDAPAEVADRPPPRTMAGNGTLSAKMATKDAAAIAHSHCSSAPGSRCGGPPARRWR
jgi:hypothetical protein